VQRHFAAPGVTVIAQARATPASYAASGPEHFTYIHFVAHGTASRSSPLDSAVVLSPAPSSPDDFKLYAREIVQHPLHARLVTVSACYGSGVRSYAGEGLVGLAWAFLRAGSHDVISALWEVNDSATPLMMDRLYDEIQAGKAPDVALRSAKLSLIHSPNVYRKPFYWGRSSFTRALEWTVPTPEVPGLGRTETQALAAMARDDGRRDGPLMNLSSAPCTLPENYTKGIFIYAHPRHRPAHSARGVPASASTLSTKLSSRPTH